uniref:Uncharacterized protein n=1 Tax=Cacopsylla melanoneura TaxID=428564 RepID=A0A8D9E9N0_9HEMI
MCRYPASRAASRASSKSSSFALALTGSVLGSGLAGAGACFLAGGSLLVVLSLKEDDRLRFLSSSLDFFYCYNGYEYEPALERHNCHLSILPLPFHFYCYNRYEYEPALKRHNCYFSILPSPSTSPTLQRV